MSLMDRLLRYFVQLTTHHAMAVVGVFLVATVVAATWLVMARPLRLDTSFATLLPDELPCVKESRRVSKIVGSTDYLYVAIASPVASDNLSLADDLVKALAQLPELDWVSAREDKEYFSDRRLWYLETDDLRRIADRAKERLDFEKKKANPFFVMLDDESPPDIGFSDIMAAYREKLAGYGIGGVFAEDETLDEVDGDGDRAVSVSAVSSRELNNYISNDDGTLVTVMARPARSAVDMAFGRKLVQSVEAIIADVDPHRNEHMRVEVAGAYRNRYLEYKNIVGDVVSSLAISVVLIVGIILVFFRRLRMLVLVLVPLLVGILLSVAMTALTVGRLNMVTALIFAVLLGLGIDFGVHMSTRYLAERGAGKSLEAALRLALLKTGRAIVTAGLTTASGLAVLLMARFKGFSEFGLIATMGVLLCLITYIVLLPAMASLFERISVPRPWGKRFGYTKGPWVPVSGKILVPISVLLIGVTGYALYQGTQIEFEYNFRNLGSKKSVSSTIKYGKTLSQSSSPVVAVLDTSEQARRVTRYLETILESGDADPRAALLKNAFSIHTFIPDEQDEKEPIMGELAGYVDEALRLKKLTQSTRRRLEDLARWTAASRITMAQLPLWVRGKFTQKDGVVGTLVYLFPKVNEFDVDEMSLFYDVYQQLNVPGVGVVRPTASGFILVEVIRAVQSDGVRMLLGATAVVFVLLLLDQRSWKKAAITFVPLVVGLVWTAGLMGLFDIKLGLYNILVIPVLLGIGVDAAVHFYHAYQEHGPGSLRYVFRTTGVAILVASATTGVGFTGMILVSHRGLSTIGVMAVTGIAASLAGSLLTIGLFLAAREAIACKGERT